MTRILITGPIGSGKSEARRYLSSLGYPCFDCDSACKELYDTVPGLKARVEKAIDADFKDIGIIFRDESKRRSLEAVVYPVLAERIREWYDACSGDPAFIESAIALQKPLMDGLYDKVLMVTAEREVRVARNPKVLERDDIQTFDLSRIDYIIDNNGGLEDLHVSIDKYLKTL